MDERQVVTHRKKLLDREVARLLGMNVRDVSAVTSEFIQQIIKRLVEMEQVNLDGFGIMKMSSRKNAGGRFLQAGLKKGTEQVEMEVSRKYHVTIRKARPFKTAITARHGSPAKKR
jgi:nucleoid DNA-binding protein